MLNKNDIVTLTVGGISGDGFGVARYSDEDTKDFVVFIANTAINDTVKAIIVKVLKNFAFAKCVEVLSPSEDRIAVDCAVFEKCGGCCYRHIDYGSEKKYKKKYIEDCFAKNYSVCPVPVSDPIGSNENCEYRNKVQYPISPNGKCGYYAINSHRVIEHDDCSVTDGSFRLITSIFEKFISDHAISVYDEMTGKGLLRHLYIRKAPSTGEIMVTVVINGSELPFSSDLVGRLKSVEGVKSIYLNINRKNSNVILGSKCMNLWGEETITDVLCGLRFEISPLSFYQVNSKVCAEMYGYVKKILEPDKNDVLLDLYCGIGTIGLTMADSFGYVYGVEVVEQAVNNAARNAYINGIKNFEVFYADAAETLSLIDKLPVSKKPTVITVDPPRKGLDTETVNAILSIKPKKIAYISCNPATLTRDLEILDRLGGYKPTVIQPFDMFPRTKHVETVCLLSRKAPV